MIIILALVAVATVLVGAAVPPYLRTRQARTAAERQRLEEEATTRAAAQAEEQDRATAAATAAAAEERAEAQADPVRAVFPAAIEGVHQLLPWRERMTAADRAHERADLAVSRATQRRAEAAEAVPRRHDTPVWHALLLAAPVLVGVVVGLETVLNSPIFKPLVGRTLAPAVAVLAAGVLAGAAVAAGLAVRRYAAERAERGHASYGTLVALLGAGLFAVAAVAGMTWLAPARSAGPHDEAVAAARDGVALATTRAAESAGSERSLAGAQARLADAEALRDDAATTDRIVVLGTSALGMGLVEMLLLGAPLRARRRADRDLDEAELARTAAAEHRVTAKADHRARLNPIVNQMITHLVGHGLDADRSRRAVEEAFAQTQVVEGVDHVLDEIRQLYAAPALDHQGHEVVVGDVVPDEVVTGDVAAAVADPAVPADPATTAAAPTAPRVVAGPATGAASTVGDDEVVDLDAPEPSGAPADAPVSHPSLDDLDMSS